MAVRRHHSAARIALALGRTRQAVARALASTRPDGCAIAAGASVAAWSFAALPAAMQSELESAAQGRGQRNAESLLASPGAPWQPPLALADIAPACLEKASKLQRALARALERRNDATISAADLERIGLEDYTREFGHAISARALRSHLKRVLDRDAGASNFNRLEIYLPERPGRKAAPKPALSFAIEAEFQPLRDTLATFTNPAAPNASEKSLLWLRVLETYGEQLSAGKAPKKARRMLLKFMERAAPFLVSPGSSSIANSLRVNFQRKYDRWINGGHGAAALADGRKENSGRWRGPALSEADLDAVKSHAAINCGGRISQAWRELLERNLLSESLASYYVNNPASKSYVPRRIRDLVKHEVAMLEDIHHGPRQDKLNGAHISRDWSAVHSLDWFQADDATLPIYYFEPDGNGWFNLMRGQTLLMIDLRSTRILGFVLISERTYNAAAIRTLTTKVCDEYGLPARGFYYENGIWKSSKLLKGSADDALSWGETEMGLREFGLKFRHARLPRAKPVEGIMGAVQNLMEGLPGYVGRNEQIEKFERVQTLMGQVKARKLDPQGHFMDREQWIDELGRLAEAYNSTRQDGKMCAGLSPDEAFEKCRNLADPPIQFSAQCRYLLAHHKRPVVVTSNGITLRFGKQAFNYRNAATGNLRGQNVLAWFNPEMPEILTVTDMNRQNPFCVSRSPDVPAMDASPEILEQEYARIAAHGSHARERYKILKAKNPITFRPMLADRATVELGAEIGQQREALETVRREDERMETKGRRMSNKLGMVGPPEKLRRPGIPAALERLGELLGSDNPQPTT